MSASYTPQGDGTQIVIFDWPYFICGKRGQPIKQRYYQHLNFDDAMKAAENHEAYAYGRYTVLSSNIVHNPQHQTITLTMRRKL
jgi:hypothetical protein